MTDIKYVNSEHKKLIEKYIKNVKKQVYFATEDSEGNIFKEYMTILNTVFMYSNNFYSSMFVNNKMTEEFMFLVPNMTFYMTVGFLSALKNKDNEQELDRAVRKMILRTEELTGQLADILIDREHNFNILDDEEEESDEDMENTANRLTNNN